MMMLLILRNAKLGRVYTWSLLLFLLIIGRKKCILLLLTAVSITEMYPIQTNNYLAFRCLISARQCHLLAIVNHFNPILQPTTWRF